ncbi:MAG: protein kinase [Planctomycetaceae bacterium]
MTRLAICPQQHIWSPVVTDQGQPELTCPICGTIGEPTAPELIATVHEYESIAADALPPIVPLSTVIPVGRPNARRGDSPDFTVPEIADYEIVRELGRGGMGVVYLARHQTLKRLVALKMIRGDVSADDGALLRFQREAEAVARLQHHAIVQIHEVGTHRGSPYLALEFIDGDNLAQRLRGTTMPPKLAAGLVESLARTIHYAHQNGIVHRDLTPRNVLLARSTSTQGVRLSTADTEACEPKITDFGLAKELDADIQQTQSGVIMGTPSYMSPEQARGLPNEIGPCTDIHALGAVLYEALTGRPPFMAATQLETLMQVIEQEPVPPTKLQRTVPRDLETICLKCLEKDPRKRYERAEDLADDLRRFISNEPIHARPVSLFERVWKLTRRHPARAGLVAVSLLAVLTLTLGGIAYNARLRSERDRAKQNAELVMEAVDKMLTEVGEEQLAVEPRMEEKRRALLAEALKLYQGLLALQRDDPTVRFETAQSHRRMGEILNLLGDHEQAVAAYGEARTLLEQLLADSPDDGSYAAELAHCENMRGEALRAVGRNEEAAAAYERAMAVLESSANRTSDVAADLELASVLYNIGILRKQSQQFPEAEAKFRRAIDLLAAPSGETSRTTPGFQQHLARAYLNLATVIPAGDRFADAKNANEQAIEIFSTLTRAYPEKPDYRYERAIASNNLGNLMARTGRFPEARDAYQQAREEFAVLARDFPKTPLYRRELANSLNSKGSILSRDRNWSEAASAWSEAALLLEELVNEAPELTSYRGDLGMVLGNLGIAYDKLQQPAEARRQIEKSIKHLNLVLAAGSDDELTRQLQRNNYQNLAEAHIASHDHPAAAQAARSLSEISPANELSYFVAACYFARCVRETEDAGALAADERAKLSKQYGDEAIAALRRAVELGFHDDERFEKETGAAFRSIASRPEFVELAAEIRKKGM